MTDSFVDLSDNNATPDLEAYAAAGRTSIALKATEGTGYVWVGGNTLHDQGHSHGLGVGRYGWPRPEFGGVVQAEAFVRAVEPHLDPARDWWFGDVEASYNYSTHQVIPDPPGWAAQIEAFLNRIHELLPEVPGGAYTGTWYCEGKPSLTAVLKQWPIILSDYSDASPPPNPLGFRLAAHQYTDLATVPGCPSRVDDNHWLDRAALTASDEMEQIMTWYPSKAAYEQAMLTLMQRANARVGYVDHVRHVDLVADGPNDPHNQPTYHRASTAVARVLAQTPAQRTAELATVESESGPVDATGHFPDPAAAARPTPWPQHRATPHDVTGA